MLNASSGRAFANANLRKAVNYGVDRTTIAGVVSFLADNRCPLQRDPGFVGQSFYPLSGDTVLAASYAGDAGVAPSTRRSVTMCAATD